MRIRKIVLEAPFLQTLKEFYSFVLELPVEIKGQELHVQVGATEIIFFEAAHNEPFYHLAINIPSNKIEEAKTWLEKKLKLLWIEDYQSEVADFVNWRAKSIYFFDPAGNILELIARRDLDNPDTKPFSGEQLLSVSEIGWVLDDHLYNDGVKDLLSKYSLSYFTKQPPLPGFCAIGDDEGLFIVVPANRDWYPTNKPSSIFPVYLEFEHDGNRYTLSN